MEYTDILTNTVTERNAKIVLELGVGEGFSTIALLKGIYQTDGFLFSCDVYSCKSGKNRVNETGLQDKWCFTQADDLEFVKKWKKQVDILYLDTSHYSMYTYLELKAFSPFIKSNGVILLHDTLHNQYTNEQGWDVMLGVVNFLKEEKDWKFKELLPDDIGLCGLGTMWRKNGEE